jgi:ribosome maturation factor RimP
MGRTVETAQVEAIVEPVCRAHGVELVQVALVTEHGQAVLRVLIDRPGSERGPGLGVTLADCQGVSRDLNTALDVHDVVPGRYRLEVSSPGLDRPLVKPHDYERFAGREVKLQTRTPLPDGRGGERRNFRGQLLGIDGETVRVEVDGTPTAIPYAEIAKANVVHRFERGTE